MDLKIAGRTAIVCGASAGLGRGTARALALNGVEVIIAARSRDRLEEAARSIGEEAGRPVRSVVADVTTEEGRLALLKVCPSPDIVINNAGGPPTGDFREWDRETWIKALDASMLSAIFLIKATIDGMIKRRWGRIINITSSMVKAPSAVLGLSNGARAGLTGFVGGLARDVAGHGVTINSVLPGQFDTDRLRSIHQRAAQTSGRDFDTVRSAAIRNVPAGRLGQPDEFGAVCAFLCSEHAGYITGQNFLLDGGQFPGLL